MVVTYFQKLTDNITVLHYSRPFWLVTQADAQREWNYYSDGSWQRIADRMMLYMLLKTALQ